LGSVKTTELYLHCPINSQISKEYEPRVHDVEYGLERVSERLTGRDFWEFVGGIVTELLKHGKPKVLHV